MPATEPPGLRQFRSAGRKRELSALIRRLPDAIIIGAAKGGTTSLFHYLRGHPEVSPPGRKEIHYFDADTDPVPVRRYRAWFPVVELRRRTLTCEATPGLLWLPQCPARVRAVVPKVKLIALLREPAARAFSQYQMEVARGLEELTFEEALAQEEDRLARIPIPTSPPGVRHLGTRVYSDKERGRYVAQLERWLDEFPPTQLLVLRSEDLFEEPAKTFSRVLTFLGLDTNYAPLFDVHQQGTPGDVDPDTFAALRRELAADNAGLLELAGIDPQTWTTITPWEELTAPSNPL